MSIGPRFFQSFLTVGSPVVSDPSGRLSFSTTADRVGRCSFRTGVRNSDCSSIFRGTIAPAVPDSAPAVFRARCEFILCRNPHTRVRWYPGGYRSRARPSVRYRFVRYSEKLRSPLRLAASCSPPVTNRGSESRRRYQYMRDPRRKDSLTTQSAQILPTPYQLARENETHPLQNELYGRHILITCYPINCFVPVSHFLVIYDAHRPRESKESGAVCTERLGVALSALLQFRYTSIRHSMRRY